MIFYVASLYNEIDQLVAVILQGEDFMLVLKNHLKNYTMIRVCDGTNICLRIY